MPNYTETDILRLMAQMKARSTGRIVGWVTSVCGTCGSEDWLARPSGAIVCAQCGGPYVATPEPTPRP